MSKKNLLNESTVRQFMKYANIGALAENFVTETYGEEEVVEEGGYMEEEEEIDVPVDDVPVDDVPVDDMPVDDVDVEGAAELDMSEEEAMALAQGLVDALTDLTGHEFTASSAEASEELPVDAELPGDEGPVDASPIGDIPPEEEEVLEGVDMIDEDEVVNETLRRVTKRIKSMKNTRKRDRMVEQVTNRIMARIKKNK